MRILIIGAGHQAKVVWDIVQEAGLANQITGFLDAYENPSLWGKTLCGKPIFGSTKGLEQLKRRERLSHFIVALGDNHLRRHLFLMAAHLGLRPLSAIHPMAVVSRSARLGEGVMIHPGAVVGVDARIDDGCIINTSSSVDHDCLVEGFCHIAPGAHLGGNVRVGECTLIGIGASVRQELKIGRDCIIGAGAAVVRDVPDGAIVMGVPARAAPQSKERTQA
jgi:sugar O-acyltransferase (sialic acid O-acetyltransferase NeuD family)